jgi:hypothetical protein
LPSTLSAKAADWHKVKLANEATVTAAMDAFPPFCDVQSVRLRRFLRLGGKAAPDGIAFNAPHVHAHAPASGAAHRLS